MTITIIMSFPGTKRSLWERDGCPSHLSSVIRSNGVEGGVVKLAGENAVVDGGLALRIAVAIFVRIDATAEDNRTN